MSGGENLLPKFMRISFSGVYLAFEMFQDTSHSNKENSSVCWNAALSCAFMASNYANGISFPSRSDLVLDADHSLVFQEPISFYRRLSRFVVFRNSVLACSHKNAIAHMNTMWPQSVDLSFSGTNFGHILTDFCFLPFCVVGTSVHHTPNRESKPLWYNDHMGSSVSRSPAPKSITCVRLSSQLDTLRTWSPYC